MKPADFRRIALGLPGTEEKSHFGVADFRVGGRIYAELGWPDAGFGSLKLTRDQQEMLMDAEPGMFERAPGAFGQKGATLVQLAVVDAPTLKSALTMAWRNRAPRKLAATVPEAR